MRKLNRGVNVEHTLFSFLIFSLPPNTALISFHDPFTIIPTLHFHISCSCYPRSLCAHHSTTHRYCTYSCIPPRLTRALLQPLTTLDHFYLLALLRLPK